RFRGLPEADSASSPGRDSEQNTLLVKSLARASPCRRSMAWLSRAAAPPRLAQKAVAAHGSFALIGAWVSFWVSAAAIPKRSISCFWCVVSFSLSPLGNLFKMIANNFHTFLIKFYCPVNSHVIQYPWFLFYLREERIHFFGVLQNALNQREKIDSLSNGSH
ncbi:MAG TPA: hypothetical protein VJ508_15885, partial [Saprospiraceae bacterium]|nr:hypothetical protein [Saprospiraceae bacterium]